jgi:hypothetical protein
MVEKMDGSEDTYMSEKDLETIAEFLASKLAEKQGPCSLTASEQQAVKDLIKTRKSAVRVFIWICGALVLLAIKDIYVYILNHLTFR